MNDEPTHYMRETGRSEDWGPWVPVKDFDLAFNMGGNPHRIQAINSASVDSEHFGKFEFRRSVERCGEDTRETEYRCMVLNRGDDKERIYNPSNHLKTLLDEWPSSVISIRSENTEIDDMDWRRVAPEERRGK